MRGVDLWVITGSGAARAGAIFLLSACVRWRGLGQDKGARAGVAHWLRCATPGGGVVCHRAGTLPPVRDAGLAGAGHPTCARLASHPWPLASLSVPAARVPSLVWSVRGRPGGAFACRHPRVGTVGPVSPALPVSALRVTAMPMGIGDAGGVRVFGIVCIRPALSLRTQARRGGKSGIEPFIAKWPMILLIR